ncbi:Variable outer membrane protein (plasmid) [Borrelia crocidurae DOU]|uniref:Variable outer membrane protein n=1 Tax=Borrelia crocidurae DOU TaxID=1293575 RepID=W5SJA9_9SPIR|nr:Vsp/OspC family lipoprotein [Borrelia crocidurae]AHH06975.1 Variable outer membrane protein [Borrelia crocidurae DOU]
MDRMRVKGIILMVMMVMGCNSGGVSGEGTGGEGKGRKGDGSVIDLKVIGDKIKSAVEFVEKVKEVETLVKSVDELAKAIKKKIQADGLTDDNELKKQVTAARAKSDELINKWKEKHTDIGKADGAVTEIHAKEAIKRDNGTKDKGAKELGELNTAIDALLKGAKDVVEGVISELTVRSAVKE